MTLYIKNMVCNRCIMVVKQVFTQEGIEPFQVKLGEVELAAKPSAMQLENIQKKLTAVGFEILNDEKSQTIEKMKNLIVHAIHQQQEPEKNNFSRVLSGALHKDYSYLSKLFSEVEGITIEKFIINQKIEKAKELLIYGEMNLNEIAWQMGYSSTAHLSTQFKNITGFSPTEFKKLKDHHRRPLDSI